MSQAVSASFSPAPVGRFALRLAGVGAVVFLANAGLLVLQLVAGPLLSPFIGSSLETWTSVIAAFLSGIALGNFLGGRVAERPPSVRRLALVLAAGVAATLWVTAFPMILSATDLTTKLGLSWSVRTPILAFVLCLPVATVLSLLTPLAIRFGVPDVTRTGQVAGTVFALSSLGCLLGNYVTGFWLIPEFSINTIVFGVAGLLAVTGGATMLLGGGSDSAPSVAVSPTPVEARPVSRESLPMVVGFLVVFCCSFGGMALELAASRIMALKVGVSLFTWTGVIGVMLAGTCLGNWLGGKFADRASRGATIDRPLTVLAGCLLGAGVMCVMILLIITILGEYQFSGLGLIGSVIANTFVLFFLPMTMLGMISPQVIRLCVKDVRTAGQTAGRIYAVSTAGAIVGTLATGYVLISAIGMKGTVLLAAVLPTLATCLLIRIWKHPAMLYVMSAVMGSMLGGAVLMFRGGDNIIAETNYYTIRILPDWSFKTTYPPLSAVVGGMPINKPEQIRLLYLDLLLHSEVNLDDPEFFRYRHEQVQLEAVYAAAERKPHQRVLVIGGGGYTFPRATRTLIPTADVDVVEIDPGVTRAAYDYLGLDPKLNITSFNRDGRQFVAEVAAPKSYDVVSLDAVNDLSVPGHLLTKECNDAIKRTLADNGVYLVTVIDLVQDGRLWKAAYRTLSQSFKYVYFTLPLGDVKSAQRTAGAYREAARRLGRRVIETKEMTREEIAQLVAADRLDRPLTPDDKTINSDYDSMSFSQYSNTTQACRVVAKRLGVPEVSDAEITIEDAIRSMDRHVIVIYASDTPLDSPALDQLVRKRTGIASDTYVLPQKFTDEMLSREKEVLLSDQYCPVDNLMAIVFLKR